jgi:uncharacterized protein (TIGR02145 family)
MKIKKIFISTCLLIGTMGFTALDGGEKESDGKTFKTIKIGNQEWMVDNLNIDRFRNGDLITEARTRTEWQRAGREQQPVWCFYSNDITNGEKYGRLYNWYAVNDPRGLAPAGWHVPSDKEWTELIKYLGGEEIAGSKLKSDSGWKEKGNGGNNSQFSALPGGACADDGYLGSIGYLGVWWSSTVDTSYYYDSTAYAWYRYLYFSDDKIIRYSHSKGNGFSVRCIKDVID